jgi:predicted aspartyl protease
MEIQFDVPYVDVTLENVIKKKSLKVRALIDTGATSSCLTRNIIRQLELPIIGVAEVVSVTGKFTVNIYLASFLIDGQKFENVQVMEAELGDDTAALIGWDIIKNSTLLSSISSKLVGQVTHFLTNIPSLKKSLVLILGQDTTEIFRLRIVQQHLAQKGYNGIIVKEQPDINIQSIEEKVNMLASLCRFIVCDNSFTSGHIDELKICAINRFVTAIIQEKGKGATWMQVDYKYDFSFMNTFYYDDPSDIPNAANQAIAWAENKLNDRKLIYDKIYTWRSP